VRPPPPWLLPTGEHFQSTVFPSPFSNFCFHTFFFRGCVCFCKILIHFTSHLQLFSRGSFPPRRHFHPPAPFFFTVFCLVGSSFFPTAWTVCPTKTIPSLDLFLPPIFPPHRQPPVPRLVSPPAPLKRLPKVACLPPQDFLTLAYWAPPPPFYFRFPKFVGVLFFISSTCSPKFFPTFRAIF